MCHICIRYGGPYVQNENINLNTHIYKFLCTTKFFSTQQRFISAQQYFLRLSAAQLVHNNIFLSAQQYFLSAQQYFSQCTTIFFSMHNSIFVDSLIFLSSRRYLCPFFDTFVTLLLVMLLLDGTIDPNGTVQRKAQCLRRRRYTNPGPNFA